MCHLHNVRVTNVSEIIINSHSWYVVLAQDDIEKTTIGETTIADLPSTPLKVSTLITTTKEITLESTTETDEKLTTVSPTTEEAIKLTTPIVTTKEAVKITTPVMTTEEAVKLITEGIPEPDPPASGTGADAAFRMLNGHVSYSVKW